MSEIISLSHKYNLHKISKENIQNVSVMFQTDLFLGSRCYNVCYSLLDPSFQETHPRETLQRYTPSDSTPHSEGRPSDKRH
jgi:hypothetical protein